MGGGHRESTNDPRLGLARIPSLQSLSVFNACDFIGSMQVLHDFIGVKIYAVGDAVGADAVTMLQYLRFSPNAFDSRYIVMLPGSVSVRNFAGLGRQQQTSRGRVGVNVYVAHIPRETAQE